jgi:hypothetical protein
MSQIVTHLLTYLAQSPEFKPVPMRERERKKDRERMNEL